MKNIEKQNMIFSRSPSKKGKFWQVLAGR